MNTEDVKTPAQLAEEARNLVRDAADSTSNFAQASQGVAHDAARSLKADAAEARALGRDAGAAASAYLNDARATGRDAVATARSYAKDAAAAVSARVEGVKDQLQTAKQQGTRYVADQPMRSALFAAAGGAILTAILVSFIRGGKR